MSIRFDPNNNMIKLCMMGMSLEEKGQTEEAAALFRQAWDEAADDYERFISAYHLSRLQKSTRDSLQWLQTSLRCAQNINDDDVKSAYPALYAKIAECFEAMGDYEHAKEYDDLSNTYRGAPSGAGPFYHGTKADLRAGDLLTAGGNSNYKDELKMNHIYFTANLNGAGLAAALAKGEGRERVYIVEPTGEFENDPNLTDKKFPGNLTRSYRSREPLRIIGEAAEWAKLTDSQRGEWQEKLAKNKGEIIN